MQRVLGLLLLGAEGALAQSRETSKWDKDVPGYGGTVVGCPCVGTCRTGNTVTKVEQTSSSSVTATFASNTALKFAYLTDQDGTIIDYKAGGSAWDPTLEKTIAFTWGASEAPTGVVPHIVYADTCEDVKSTTATSTWLNKLALRAQEYDVAGSSSADSSATDGTPSFDLNADITLNTDWFNKGGTFSADFPLAKPVGLNVAWLKNQDGTILNYKELGAADPTSFPATPFPRGSVGLHACRLFPTQKLCTSKSIAPLYMNKIDGIGAAATTDVGTYSTTDAVFTDAFTGSFNAGVTAGSGTTSIAPNPKREGCTQYVMYAKNVDGDVLLGFGFDKALKFAATPTTKYKIYLTCDGTTLTTGTMDLAVFSSANSVFSVPVDEVKVGFPKCVGDHAADNTTWFEVDGRSCMCDKGTLFCKKGANGSYFLMNEGESVGLALSVSVIVLLLLCGGIFMLLKKSAQSSEKMVVLKDNVQSPEDRL